LCTPRVDLLASRANALAPLNAGEAWIQSRHAVEGFELFGSPLCGMVELGSETLCIFLPPW